MGRTKKDHIPRSVASALATVGITASKRSSAEAQTWGRMPMSDDAVPDHASRSASHDDCRRACLRPGALPGD